MAAARGTLAGAGAARGGNRGRRGRQFGRCRQLRELARGRKRIAKADKVLAIELTHLVQQLRTVAQVGHEQVAQAGRNRVAVWNCRRWRHAGHAAAGR